MVAIQQQQTELIGSKRLAGKVALVTGGSRGIGAAIALRLAAEGVPLHSPTPRATVQPI